MEGKAEKGGMKAQMEVTLQTALLGWTARAVPEMLLGVLQGGRSGF